MPSARGFEITIEGIDDIPFTTYGTRHHGKIQYTNIEAKDGVRFQIRVRAEVPFPEPEDASIGKPHTESRYRLRSSKKQDDLDAMDCDEKPKRPYGFIARVYMNGLSKWEDTSILAIDPTDKFYSSEGHVFEGRCCNPILGKGGSKSEMIGTFPVLPWMFSQKGIDVLLDQINLSKANVDLQESSSDIADVTQAMANSLSESPSRKTNQIEVVIGRIVLGEATGPSTNYWKTTDVTVEGDNGDSTQVAIDRENTQHIRAKTVKTIPYRADENFWTKIIFQYHDITKLVGLGLCDRFGTPITKRALALPAPSSNTEFASPLKRLRLSETVKAKASIDGNMSSDEDESASSESSSDSDVPQRKKFRESNSGGRRKAKSLKSNMKALSLRGRNAAEKTTIQSLPAIESSSFNFKLDEAKSTDNQLQLVDAGSPQGASTAAANGLVLATNEIVQMDAGASLEERGDLDATDRQLLLDDAGAEDDIVTTAAANELVLATNDLMDDEIS